MLAFIDLPAYLAPLDEQARRRGAELAQALAEALEPRTLPAGQDATRAAADSLVYVESGCLKWQDGARLVRLYNDGDWLEAAPEGVAPGTSATSEFTAQLRVIARPDFEARLGDPARAAQWDQYRGLQQRLLLGIAGALAREDVAPNTRMARHRTGDVIVTEGSPPDEVFILLEGAASVQVRGNAVGTIGEGEVFGEISFLTGQPRSATVVASCPCLVQVIEREQFAVMARANPQLMVHVATTLASRVVDLNGKLQARGR